MDFFRECGQNANICRALVYKVKGPDAWAPVTKNLGEG